MTGVIERRLASDRDKLHALVASSGGTLELISAKGNPPREYVIVYRCTGIARIEHSRPVLRHEHRVEISLPANYPAEKPVARMLTPVFHMHVFPSNTVCIGQWHTNESLEQLVLRIGQIIQYDPEIFDFKSIADSAAANWTRSNMSMFPVGKVTFRRAQHDKGPVQWKNLA